MLLHPAHKLLHCCCYIHTVHSTKLHTSIPQLQCQLMSALRFLDGKMHSSSKVAIGSCWIQTKMFPPQKILHKRRCSSNLRVSTILHGTMNKRWQPSPNIPGNSMTITVTVQVGWSIRGSISSPSLYPQQDKKEHSGIFEYLVNKKAIWIVRLNHISWKTIWSMTILPCHFLPPQACQMVSLSVPFEQWAACIEVPTSWTF